jgi:hypothetical protein
LAKTHCNRASYAPARCIAAEGVLAGNGQLPGMVNSATIKRVIQMKLRALIESLTIDDAEAKRP